MKKLVLALLVGIAVFATASIAAAEVTVGGEVEIRYDLWDNLSLNGNATESSWMSGAFANDRNIKTQTFFADRILLNVDAKIAEGLEAFVEFDTVDSERVWGVNHTDGFAHSAVNYQGNSIRMRQAWVNFMVPGIPVGVKIGHQPLALGHGIFLDTHRDGTDAILVYSKPIDQLLLAGVYSKVVEGSTSVPGLHSNPYSSSGITGNEHNDADVWAALANFTFMPSNTVGVNYLFVHDASTGATFPNDMVIRLHNVGLTADGVIGPITYKAEADYQNMNLDLGGDTLGFNNSWAAMVGVGAKVSMVNVGMEVAYGSGTNASKADPNDPFSTKRLNQGASRTYINPYGTTSYNYAFLYNDKIGQGSYGTEGGSGFGDGTGGFGLANTGYIKLTAGVNPTDKLGIDMAVLYLRASGNLSNRVDNAWDFNYSGWNGRSKDLGWEIDAHAGYKIYDNLNLDVTGGVFLPGAWYAFTGQVPGSNNLNAVVEETDNTTNYKRDPAWGLETKLTCKF